MGGASYGAGRLAITWPQSRPRLPQVFQARHRPKVDLRQFNGEALRQLMAIFSNFTGLVKPSAEWRRTGL
jgi:hypothetical protein